MNTENNLREMPSKLRKVLARPLIIGASVSANYQGVPSPGKQLALRTTDLGSIVTIAKNGSMAETILSAVGKKTLADRTCVIAIDLLFWDSTRQNPASSIRAFKNFTEEVMTLQLPMVIGNVPAFYPQMQFSLPTINREIRHFKDHYKKCILFPFEDIYQKMIKQGYIEHERRKYTLKQMIPDGLHISQAGSSVLADILETTWVNEL